MNVVWVLTAVWSSYLGLWAYLKFGRQKKGPQMDMKKEEMPMDMGAMGGNMQMHMNMPSRPHWQTVSLSALHCGAGCTLADVIGETFTYHVPITIGSSLILGSWIFDFILALIIGVFFQFYAIREMQKISFFKGIAKAFKADVFSLSSWQVGMYGWMAIVYFVLFKNNELPKTSPEFWFMMQVAMLFGFFCAYPMNAFLIKLGIKKGM